MAQVLKTCGSNPSEVRILYSPPKKSVSFGFYLLLLIMDQRFGGVEGRRKGGIVSQQKRRLFPQHYASLGCNVAKTVKSPRKNYLLSEIIGIILGDGGITNNQLSITLNAEKDINYDIYVQNAIHNLFNISSGKFKIKNTKAVCIKVSGVNFIKALNKFGLNAKNKVREQAGVPTWISNNLNYSKWCLRGLMDTDGGVFINKYKINNKEYTYNKICFTNKSSPLLKFVHQTLQKLGYHPCYCGNNKVWIASYKEVSKYLKHVGSSNYRLLKYIK